MKKPILAAGVALFALGMVPQAAWAEGNSYDAPTLALGGTYVSRYDDILSPYFNPADLHHVRGYFYIGPALGVLVGTNAGTYQDILGAMQPQPTGEFGSLMTYIKNAQAYSSAAATAFKNGTDPGAPPTAGAITVPGNVDISAKIDSGLVGLNIPFAEDSGFGWRAYARVGLTPFIEAPQLSQSISAVLQGDHDLATGLLTLEDDVQNGNLSALSGDASNLKNRLAETLGPFNTPQGMSFSLGAQADAYLANAFTYEMPLPFIKRPLGVLQDGDTTLGFTLKLFTGGGAIGANQLMQQALDSAVPSLQQLAVGIPGRYTLTNTISLAKPLADLNSALDSFVANPASSSAALTAAAAEIPQGYSMNVESDTAGPVGVGLDIGTIFPLKGGFRVGAVLQNIPQAFWPGQKTVYKGTLGSTSSSGGSSSNPLGNLGFSLTPGPSSFVNYTYSEPTALRLGAGWEFAPLGISAAAEVGEAFDNPANTLWVDTPTLNLGVQESLFNIVYLRIGTQIAGPLDTLYGGGVGLNVGIARVDLGAAISPGLNDVNGALSVDVGI